MYRDTHNYFFIVYALPFRDKMISHWDSVFFVFVWPQCNISLLWCALIVHAEIERQQYRVQPKSVDRVLNKICLVSARTVSVYIVSKPMTLASVSVMTPTQVLPFSLCLGHIYICDEFSLSKVQPWDLLILFSLSQHCLVLWCRNVSRNGSNLVLTICFQRPQGFLCCFNNEQSIR